LQLPGELVKQQMNAASHDGTSGVPALKTVEHDKPFDARQVHT
jgi:hypothetical protein